MSLLKVNNLIKSIAVCGVALALSFSLVGCGTSATPSVNTSADENVTSDDNNSSDVTQEQIDTALDSANDASVDEGGILNDVTTFETGENHRFAGQHVTMEIVGMEEFESLKSDMYEDVPADGNVFVVFYMEMANNDGTEIYFTPDYCEFDVDGVATKNTILVNEPNKEFNETIYGWVTQTGNGFYYDKRGFMVIEAPKDWKNIKFTYTGWQYDGFGNIIVVNNLTRDDLHLPE